MELALVTRWMYDCVRQQEKIPQIIGTGQILAHNLGCLQHSALSAVPLE